jgi:small subunit ribosomal protein S9
MTAETTIFIATGRRKSSTARIRITEGTGKLVANGRDFDDYFSHENFAKAPFSPLSSATRST